MLFSDRVKIPSQRRLTDEGFLIVPAFIARPGIQLYTAAEMGLSDRDPRDVIRVYRPPEEVFNQESLASFSNKPITNGHPSELLTSKNAKEFSVGHSGPEVVEDRGFAKATLHIIDSDTVEDIEKGKAELSNGYLADIAFTPGTSPDGESFDAIQRDIRGNHIAVVDKARGGSSLRVFDADPSLEPKLEEDAIMPVKVTIDGIDIEMSEQGQQAVTKLQKQVSDTQTTMDMQRKQFDTDIAKEKARADDLQAKLDAAKKEIPDAATLDAQVAERAALVADATALVPDLEWKGKSAEDIRKEVVTKVVGTLTNDSAEYVAARFDILVEDHKKDPNRQIDTALADSLKGGDGKDGQEVNDSSKSRTKFAEAQRNRWKGSAAQA